MEKWLELSGLGNWTWQPNLLLGSLTYWKRRTGPGEVTDG